jgi:S1-C subfamily serine protease
MPGLAWAGIEKPEMPSGTLAETAAPDALFGSVEKSVYVLLSAPSVQNLRARSGVKQGSAVAVSAKVALTNCHVLQGNKVHFLVKGKTLFAATVSYGDERSDRCAVEVPSGGLAPVQGIRRFSSLAVGERVYTVGSPSGLENTLGEGILSGLRKRAGVDLVQTSAPISPGSSGGGLFDRSGNLIGITTFLLRDTQNLNFAIAADAYWQ